MTTGRRKGVAIGVSALARLALSYGAILLGFGSVRGAVGLSQGRPLVVNRTELDLGRVGLDATVATELTIRNLGFRPVRIIGLQLACACMTSDLRPPYTLAGREVLKIPLHVHVTPEPGRFDRSFVIHTDNPRQRRFDMKVVADVGPGAVERVSQDSRDSAP